MRSKTRKMINMFIAAVMVLTVFFSMVKAPVSAEDTSAKRPCDKHVKEVFTQDGMNEIDLEYCFKVNLKKTRSSNKKVAQVVKNKAGVYCIRAKKPGKAKITIYAKKKGSRKYKAYKSQVTIYKYKNAFKSFMAGDQDLTSKFKVKQSCSTEKSVNGKINIEAAKGWKLDSIDFMDEDSGKSGRIKNGDPVEIKNGAISVGMVHKASGNRVTFDISIKND